MKSTLRISEANALYFLFLLSINGALINTTFGKLVFVVIYLVFVFQVIISISRLRGVLNYGIKGGFIVLLFLLTLLVLIRSVLGPISSKLLHPINIPAWTVPFAALVTYGLSTDKFFKILSRNFNFFIVIIISPWLIDQNYFDGMLFFLLPLLLPRSGINRFQKMILIVVFLSNALMKDSRGALISLFVAVAYSFYSSIPRKKLWLKLLHRKSVVMFVLLLALSIRLWTILPSEVSRKLLVDSRTWLYVDLADSLDRAGFLFGKGILGVYYGWSDTDKKMVFREAFEGFYGHVILKAGLFYLLTYLTVFFLVWIKNIDRRFGLLLWVTFFNMITYGIPNFTPAFLGLWLLIGMTMNLKRGEFSEGSCI